MLRRLITIIISCLIFPAGLLLSACSENGAHSHQRQESPSPAHAHAPAMTQKRVPAYFKEPPDLKLLPPTLSPAMFSGQTREAYQIAKDIPQTLAQLPCFCYCDYSVGHKSLHSCFEDEHSVGCALCQDSAMMAKELKGDGYNIEQIREKLIAKYSKH
jgi:Protein of unknown function with PCYCGC motif